MLLIFKRKKIYFKNFLPFSLPCKILFVILWHSNIDHYTYKP